MKGNGFRSDESGVSPVIGIVLMVAITVLLAATVAAFVFGFNDRAKNADSPTVALGFDYDSSGSDDELEIRHQSGESIEMDNLYVSVQDATCSGGSDPSGRYSFTQTGKAKAGTTLKVDADLNGGPLCSGGANNLDLSTATVHVVWDNGAGQSTTLQTWQK